MFVSNDSIMSKFVTESLLFCAEPRPSNLCAYMRRIVLGIFFTTLLYGFFALLCIAAIAAPIVLFFFEAALLFYGESLVVAVLVVGLSLDVCIVGAVIYYFMRVRVKKAAEAVRATSTVSLFVQWGKAVHDKVCPLITFK